MTRMDVERSITSHPFASLAIAFTVGAGLALRPRNALARALISTAAGTAFAVLRELATDHVATRARSWLDEQNRSRAAS